MDKEISTFVLVGTNIKYEQFSDDVKTALLTGFNNGERGYGIKSIEKLYGAYDMIFTFYGELPKEEGRMTASTLMSDINEYIEKHVLEEGGQFVRAILLFRVKESDFNFSRE